MSAERSAAKWRDSQAIRTFLRRRRLKDQEERARQEIESFRRERIPDNVIFLAGVRRKYKGTMATEEDIKRRMREQNETCVIVEHLGQMTPQRNRYKFNHL